MASQSQPLNCHPETSTLSSAFSKSSLRTLPALLSAQRESFMYNLHTIWLFNRSDLKTVVFPQTIFGTFCALSGLVTEHPDASSTLDILRRVPLVIFWVWIVLLMQTISNQRLPASIVEDAGNKPWRPIPAGRLSEAAARRLLLLCVMPATLLAGYWLGVAQETLGVTVASFLYNDLHGSDEGIVIRNLLNAVGLSGFSIGATRVAAGGAALTRHGYVWIALLAAVILCTIQTADLPDVAGDALKGRRTLPLVYGDAVARASVAVGVLASSIACAHFWAVGPAGAILAAYALGATLAARTLLLRRVEADKTTWKLWCFWMAGLYTLPVVKACGF